MCENYSEVSRSSLFEFGNVRHRDIDGSRLPVTGDSQGNVISNACGFDDPGQVRHTVDSLAIYGSNYILDNSTGFCSTLQASLGGRRIWECPNNNHPVDSV